MTANLFYFRRISRIGGTEQFLYEIAKKYHKYDITIYYDEADKEQLKRLRKLVRCRKRKKGEKISCEKAFFNFNIDMIDDVIAKEYYFVSHANWEVIGYKPPVQHPKLTHFIGVSDFSTRKLEEYLAKEKIDKKPIRCYNPLTLEPKQKVPILVSACRLDDVVKGGARTQELIKALDKYCQEHGRNYLWLLFTNYTGVELESPNVVYMKPRIDVRPYIAMADWVLQLSNDMETYCYTTNEATSYGVPIVTTPLSVYEELPITDNERIVLDWDCGNVDEVARLIFEKKVKPFKYTAPEDEWEKILVQEKSTYKDESQDMIPVKVNLKYTDLLLDKELEPGMILEMPRWRAEYLEELMLVREIMK